MVFSSNVFLLYFMPAFFLVYFLMPRKTRNYVLLLASLIFYAWGAPEFIIQLVVSTIANYFIVKAMCKTEKPAAKKWLCGLSIFISLGLLLFYKYGNFTMENLNALLGLTGHAPLTWKRILLPIGISFFSFQSVTYTLDTYRGVNKPLEKLSGTIGAVIGGVAGAIIGTCCGGNTAAGFMIGSSLGGAVGTAVDFAVVISAGFLIGTTEALYALINIFLASKVMDVIIIGFSANKACFVMSDRWQEISGRILKDMGRGVTQLTARGAYTGAERPTLLCVIGRSEIMAFKRILREEDENAFVIIVEAHEAIGDGFTMLSDSEKQ